MALPGEARSSQTQDNGAGEAGRRGALEKPIKAQADRYSQQPGLKASLQAAAVSGRGGGCFPSRSGGGERHPSL